MQIGHLYCFIVLSICYALPVRANEYSVKLSHDGPVVQGGTITFRADVYRDGERPSGTFFYEWKDNAIPAHKYKSVGTKNATAYWSLSYAADQYQIGTYVAEVGVRIHTSIFHRDEETSDRTTFEITSLLNGNMTVEQFNETLADSYVSSASEARLNISLRSGDYDYISKNATSVATFWFIDCKYYGQTNDFGFNYNFTKPDVLHNIEALVVASFEPQDVTTPSPNATSPSTTVAPNSSLPSSDIPTTTMASTTPALSRASAAVNTTMPATLATNNVRPAINVSDFGNTTFPFVCLNSSIIAPDPKKTYGYFSREINVRAPITNIVVEGTNWIQPWDMLNLNVTCKGSGPFYKCLQYHRGKYNVTGNETCSDTMFLQSCNFSIVHYFLEPSVYTILVIVNNDLSKQIYPLTINIYKVTRKPQLSVIVVPVSCTLAAVVLIVFGIAYYIQSRARFTVEVADFDFGQHNPDMEYKTFRERLRDSFNNALNPGSKRINVRSPYYGSMNY